MVSVPSLELFLAQGDDYRNAMIGIAPVKIAVEAAVRFGWDAVIGPDGIFVGMHGFGASAPYKDVYKNFGITAEAVADARRQATQRLNIEAATMTVRVGINGFGRIGRNILRAIVESGAQRHRGRRPSTILARSRRTRTCCATIRCTANSRTR